MLKFIFDASLLPDGDLGNMHGIIVDDDGFVYIVATASNQLHKFQLIGFDL